DARRAAGDAQRHLDGQPLAGVDHVEIDMRDLVAHRVALHFAHERLQRLALTLDGDVDQRALDVDAGEQPLQLVRVDGEWAALVATSVEYRRYPTARAQLAVVALPRLRARPGAQRRIHCHGSRSSVEQLADGLVRVRVPDRARQ